MALQHDANGYSRIRQFKKYCSNNSSIDNNKRQLQYFRSIYTGFLSSILERGENNNKKIDYPLICIKANAILDNYVATAMIVL